MIISHLKDYWCNHTAAVSGAGLSLINGGAIAQSVVVGVLIFIITSGLRVIVQKLWRK